MRFTMQSSSKVRFNVIAASLLALAGCGGGGSSTDGPIEALSVADSMAVVTTNGSGSPASVAPGAQADTSSFSPTCDYYTDVARAHVYDPSMEPLGTVNMILCLLKQTAYSGLLNEGVYKAQIDEESCNEGGQGSDSSSGTGQSSGAQQSFNVWVIESTRADNSSPQNVEFWIPNQDGADPDGQIRVRVTITEGASTGNPFGVFNLDYIEFTGDNTVRGLGNLRSLNALDGFIGFSFYQEHGDVDVAQMPNEHAERTQANVNMFADQSSGVAHIVQDSRENYGSGDTGITTNDYQIAYDETHLLRSTNGGAGTCLSRTDFNTRTWNYNLYDATTGARVELNSGFGFQTAGGDYGWIGYYGLWASAGVTIANGDTVTKQTYGNQTPATYTVFEAPGKLVKNTRHTLALTQLAGETFEWWNTIDVMGTPTLVRMQLVYNSGWYALAQWNDMTNSWDSLGSPSAITLAPNAYMGMWSPSLGGQVSFVNGDTFITYYSREYVTPGSDLFTSSTSVDLYGYFSCLRAGITTAEVNAGNVFLTDSTDVSMPYHYVVDSTDMSFKYDDGVTPTQAGLGSGQAPTTGPYTWGMNSGPMVASTSGLTQPWEIWSSSEFYTYETGSNPWNKYITLLDSMGAAVTFDAPIQFSYTHHTGDDANTDSTYDLHTYLLNYGGPGNFGGIPQATVDFDGDGNPDRWYPQFSILKGTLCGPTGTEYVLRPIDSEVTLSDDTGNCGLLDLMQVGDLTLPTVADWTDPALGPVPTVVGPPRVIAGEVVGSN